MERPYFPMFVDLTGKNVLVAGGGRIALRRVTTLLRFGAAIRVVAPQLCVERRRYRKGDARGADLVLAATDSREVNRAVQAECRESGIPVNVADDRNLCDFYFPSVVMTDDVVIGINSGGTDPGKVKGTRKLIEKALLEKNT